MNMPTFGPGPWDKNSQPHAQTTPLSRFRTGIFSSVSGNMPVAAAVYQARCEISDEFICLPINMDISSNGSCMAITSAGGWKDRDPVVQYFLLNEFGPDGLIAGMNRTFDPHLSEVARHILLDESNKLIFVADNSRVKSFSWENSDRREPAAVHTLDSDLHEGPLALLPQNRIVRAGKGQVILWNINDLETHGPSNKLIGEGEFDAGNTWRENDDGDIELSTGSLPHQTIKFAEKDFTPCSWHLHKPTNRLIASHTRNEGVWNYGCIAIDLEDGGKTAARFLGHGGQVEGFSASQEDGNLFATACSDGFARLYDVRHPLPVLTFNAGFQSEFCADVVFVHPNGLPSTPQLHVIVFRSF